MITKVTENVLSQSVMEHDASIRSIFVFDSEWRGIFLVMQVMFLECDIGGSDEEEVDVLVNFSGHLDTILADIVEDKDLSLEMSTVHSVFSSASLALLVFFLFLVWVRLGAFLHTFSIFLIVWFRLRLRTKGEIRCPFVLIWEMQLFVLQSLCQFTNCHEFLIFLDVMAPNGEVQ